MVLWLVVLWLMMGVVEMAIVVMGWLIGRVAAMGSGMRLGEVDRVWLLRMMVVKSPPSSFYQYVEPV